MTELKRTPLYETHLKYGGKIIDFEGWALPVQFSSIIQEHHAVRQKGGLFDVSDMGELDVRGRDATDLLEKALTNRIATMVDGQVRYSPMCNEHGGVVDDLLVYRLSPDHYMLVINAGNIEKDYQWISGLAKGFSDVKVANISKETAELCIQGPVSVATMQKLTTEDLASMGYYYFKDNVEVAGKKTLVSRTGYTGEDGFEIYCEPKDAPALWDSIIEAGKPLGVVPAGLGCRDTLRFEAAMPLYGQEMTDEIGPLEAGLKRFVDLSKDFVGRDALAKMAAEGPKRRLVGFVMVDRGIPRTGYPIVKDGKEVGHVSTGSFSPTLGKNLGLGFVPAELSQVGQEIMVRVRDKDLRAEITKIPFYRRPKEAK